MTIRLTGAGDGLVGWGFDPSPGHPLDGVALTQLIPQLTPSDPESVGLDATGLDQERRAHPNGVTAIDHVVVFTGDTVRTTEAFQQAGLDLRRERATTMGGNPTVQRFFWAGDVIIELVAPAVPDGGPASIWGIACTSLDLGATLAWLGPDRCTPAREAVQAGRRIASLRTRSLGIGTRIAVMSPYPRG